MNANKLEFIAVKAAVTEGKVVIDLEDGSTFGFPLHYFNRLASASEEELQQVRLRVGGRALRWDALDEDIWIADVILRRFPGARV